MNRNLLIFDLDGTLIDSRKDLCTGINLMRSHYGLPPLALETVAGYIGDGIRQLVARSLEDFPGADIDEAVRINYACYRRHIHDETVLYPGVYDGLMSLSRAAYAFALISNKRKEASEELLRYFGVFDLFGEVVGGDSGMPLKPHPDAILSVVRSAGVTADRTWMIGDHVTDMEAARRSGVNSVFVTYGIGRIGPESPALTFPDFDRLTRYFLNLK